MSDRIGFMANLGYWTWDYAHNEILCGVDPVLAIEQAVVEMLVSREEVIA